MLCCPLCGLARHLERPTIDDEATLIWLPEVSQAAVNATMRDVHMQLRELHEPLQSGARLQRENDGRATLHNVRAILAERIAPATARIGTCKPSELGDALLRLSAPAYDNRAALLGGLRLLPLGRYYRAGTDRYPAIVDAWLAESAPVALAAATVLPGSASPPKRGAATANPRRPL